MPWQYTRDEDLPAVGVASSKVMTTSETVMPRELSLGRGTPFKPRAGLLSISSLALAQVSSVAPGVVKVHSVLAE